MAITLGSMSQLATLNQSANLAIAKRADVSSDPFAAANKRVEQQLASTAVKLSSFSQIKSGFAEVQSAAKALTNPPATATADDTVKSAQAFANAYNTATAAVNTASKTGGKQDGALAGDVRAQLAGNDLKSIVGSGTNTNDLKNIGITLKSDGTMAVDATALKAALQANPTGTNETLTKVGQQATRVTTKELAATGNIGNSVNTLSNLSKGLETKLSDQAKYASALQSNVQQQVASFSGVGASGVASYLQTYSL